MRIEYDSEADALYVKLREPRGTLHTRRLPGSGPDGSRALDFDDDGVVGLELTGISTRGIDLAGVPQAEEIAAEIAAVVERLRPTAV